MGIGYTYLKELSPTNEIRAAQKEVDKRNGIQKKTVHDWAMCLSMGTNGILLTTILSCWLRN